MSRGRWLLAILPFGLTILAASAVAAAPLGAQSLTIVIELDTLVLLLGLLISAPIAGAVVLTRRAAKSVEQAVRQTQEEAAEERLRFVRRLDHELKNPLTAIRAGLANLPVVEGDADGALAKLSVESQVMRLSRLTADLRKLAELESRPLSEAQLVDLGELLGEAFDACRDKDEGQERTMRLTLPRAPWPLPQVRGDRDLLFLALFNLLDNAVKFTRPGDTIEVRAFEDGAHIAVEVADTGIGIHEGETRHVWEELYRGEDARAVPGSGLGLSLVRAIVEQHGGRVELRSRTGHGTVVTLRLPIGH
ncbi:MAG TPA: HAMP domain-containing sensor histidine kinase [Anaerolineales bacterium]|nr:HAMP domain-containing sensor histidine kinase [Anaerolineales bacterium]